MRYYTENNIAKNDTRPMKIEPPLGYEQITPLLKNHKVSCRRGRGDAGHISPAACDADSVSRNSNRPAATIPSSSSAGDDGSTFNAVIVLGMQAMQNLFILTDGMWDRRTYLPAYVRRYPFCMARSRSTASRRMNASSASRKARCTTQANRSTTPTGRHSRNGSSWKS